jgi:hypothetical protein
MNRTRLTALAACALVSLACAAQAQQASTAYRGAAKDPFEPRRAVVKRVKPGPKLIEPPPVEARIQDYRTRKAAAVSAQQPAPKPTTAFLLGELNVTGIFRTPRGWAAMVEAAPIKLSYTVYPGEHFFNGMLVAIEEDRLVFRRETRWSDGRRETAVELKPLGRPNAVKDGLTAAAATPASPSGPTADPNSVYSQLKRREEVSQRNLQRVLEQHNKNSAPMNQAAPQERKGIWGLIDKMNKDLTDEIEKCPGGKGTINVAEGTVTCRE